MTSPFSTAELRRLSIADVLNFGIGASFSPEDFAAEQPKSNMAETISAAFMRPPIF
jgi:hypothetical protein